MLHKAALDLSELPASPPEIKFLKSISCCQGMVKQQHRYGIHLLVMLLNNFCINSNNFFYHKWMKNVFSWRRAFLKEIHATESFFSLLMLWQLWTLKRCTNLNTVFNTRSLTLSVRLPTNRTAKLDELLNGYFRETKQVDWDRPLNWSWFFWETI